MSARDEILGNIRRSLRRGPLDAPTRAGLQDRLRARGRHVALGRTALDRPGLIALFTQMAVAVAATVDTIPDLDAVPDAVADYLARENLPARLVVAPALEGLPWDKRPLLEWRSGRAENADLVSVVPALAGVAETGTLVLPSGPQTPSTLNFLPDTHIVVLKAADVHAAYEDAFDRIRDQTGGGLPRTVNLVTGPSRTGDIEQTIMLGAHGPRRLHILLVDEGNG